MLVFTADDRYDRSVRHYDSIRAIALGAEADGFDSVWLADHLLYRNPGEPTRGVWENWTVLSALAEATRRVEIGTLVLCNSMRNPAVLAKMATAADEVSHGRVILGIGAGWNEPEYKAFGLPFDHRVDRLEEALQIIGPLLREGHVDFEGKYYSARDCDNLPRGPRPKGPPLMVGGEGPRLIRLAARYADAWNTGYFGKPETMSDRFGKIDEACHDVGRDRGTIGVTAFICLWFPDLVAKKPTFVEHPLTGTAEEIAEAMRGYGRLGVQHIMFQLEPYTQESRQRLTDALKVYRRG
ncbi:MAG: LLM class flavin-dependent oxidoreductase [Thaumarchaeota archaeon]|nr:LLM class flavin-dependent oxidoreductase [Nitrososphaerota archaeon]